MSFLSRFFKPKDEDDVLEGIEDAIEEDEQEGLLIPVEPPRNEPAGGIVQTAPDASELPATQEGDETLADLVEAAEEQAEDEPTEAEEGASRAAEPAESPPEGAGAPEEMNVSSEQEVPDAGGLEVQTVSAGEEGSGAETDDLLSAFRDTAETGQADVLMEGLEDIPARELLSELRQLRGLLPQTQTAEGDGKAGGDG